VHISLVSPHQTYLHTRTNHSHHSHDYTIDTIYYFQLLQFELHINKSFFESNHQLGLIEDQVIQILVAQVNIHFSHENSTLINPLVFLLFHQTIKNVLNKIVYFCGYWSRINWMISWEYKHTFH